MKNSFLNFLLLLTLLTSCSKNNNLALVSPNNQKIVESQQELILKIQTSLNEEKFGEIILEITDIKYFGSPKNLIAIISFKTNATNDRDIAIQKIYGKDNKLKETTLVCKGTCAGGNGCHLEGVIDPNNHDNDYVQCNCSGCKMSVVVSKNTLDVQGNTIKLEEMAAKSYTATFNETAEVNIISYKKSDYDKATIQLIEYADIKGKKSSFMIVTPNIILNIGGNSLKSGGSFEVDCTGSCDCRERFIPSTGAVECTCADCKMKVTPIN